MATVNITIESEYVNPDPADWVKLLHGQVMGVGLDAAGEPVAVTRHAMMDDDAKITVEIPSAPMAEITADAAWHADAGCDIAVRVLEEWAYPVGSSDGERIDTLDDRNLWCNTHRRELTGTEADVKRGTQARMDRLAVAGDSVLFHLDHDLSVTESGTMSIYGGWTNGRWRVFDSGDYDGDHFSYAWCNDCNVGINPDTLNDIIDY